MPQFQSVYSSSGQQAFAYLLAPDGKLPSGQPWTGIYFRTKQAKVPSRLSTLPLIFQEYLNKASGFDVITFLYFGSSTTPDPHAIGAALDAINWSAVTGKPGNAMESGAVIWIADPAAITQATVMAAPRLMLEPVLPGRTAVVPALHAPEHQPLIALAPATPGPASLFISAGGTVLIGSNAAGDALQFSCAQGLRLASGNGEAESVIANATTPIQIPVGGTHNGCLVFDGTLTPQLPGIGLGFQYALNVTDGTVASGPLSYPLLDKPNSLDGHGTSVVLSILQPLDHAESYISLKSASGAVKSAFRSLLDRTVLLTPMEDGSTRLVFNTGIGNTRYLTPQGDFSMSIGSAEPSTFGLGNQLLCGLSGVEYIHFTDGDLLRFYSDQKAGVTAQVDVDLPPPANVTFAFDTSATAKTAWAMVLPSGQSKPDGRQYYSEPDQAPFFASTTASSDALQLGYYGLSLSALPDDPGPPATPYCFPLVPYAAYVPPAAGIGHDKDYLAGFEFQLLNPTRKTLIEAMETTPALVTHTGQDAANGTAITPEGHAASFVDGAWQSLRVAQTTDGIDVGFAPAATKNALPQPLQEAFLTNQQFLVITSVEQLGTFNWNVTMNEWQFLLDVSKNTTVGDYRNVLIFKSANATVSQLARHPELWTRYRDFNDAAGDPQGRFLSGWLLDYLAQARALYADGQGVISLADFCELIDDPDWNGFLALKVDINPKTLPPEIEALLAGIDPTLLVAHHIGNQVNLVTPLDGQSGYQLNSAMFGLVHYVDPVLGAQVNNLPPYIANPQPYDFKVLTLEAVFENARLLSFSNKSVLTLNTLLGDTVTQTDATGSIPGANTLVLVGAYNERNNPAYTFSTAKGAISDFYLASNALERIEITRASMTVIKVATDDPLPQKYLARFNMSGQLRMMADDAFDLLSYDTLGFDNLGLDMHLVAGGGDRSFALDVTTLRLALAQNVAINPATPAADTLPATGSNLVRADSLLAQFPLQLTGFVIGAAGRAPNAMGFRTLDTTIPKNITPASVDGSDWYALSFNLNLGGQGALGQNGGLSAQMLLAWTPGGVASVPNILPALKIAGPGGVDLSFDIEGVVKFGAADIVLNRPTPTVSDKSPPQFVLMFESIAFTVLSFSFPPKGSTNIFLFGDTTDVKTGDVLKPTLGWFGGYFEQPAPAGSGA